MLCPRGYYCPQGSSKPTKCPMYTYQSSEGQGDCLPCPKGYMCDKEGIIMPSTLCPEGTKCEVGNYQINYETICKDEYCPEGAVMTSICPNGLYLDPNTRLCKSCPKGKKCQDGIIKDCDLYHYCDGNSIFGRLCPNGNYHDVNLAKTLSFEY
jgi:hypothetical protein